MSGKEGHVRRLSFIQGILITACIAPFAVGLLPARLAWAEPMIQHWTTQNGARVYFVPAHELPMVDIEVAFDAGSARDGGKGGVASLTSALLDDGAGDLDADQIATRFEGVGARFATDSRRDMAILTLRSLADPQLLQPALETLSLILRDPTFPRESINREKKRMLIKLRAQRQSPGEVAEKAFFKAIYGDHPYASPALGTEETLQRLTREDVLAFHRRYYVARNAVIAIVGDLDRAGAESLVRALFSAVPAGNSAPPLPPAPKPAGGRTIRIDFPSTQTHVLAGQVGMRRDDPDYFALYVGNHVLGGGGLVSRISEEIREKRGLSYSAYSYFFPMREPGPFQMGLQTRNEQAQEALHVLHETLRKFIAKGPTAGELKASKQNITGGFPLRIDSNKKILSYLALIGFYHLPLDYLDTFTSRIEAVSLEQIQDAFKRRVHPDELITVIVGGAATPTSTP